MGRFFTLRIRRTKTEEKPAFDGDKCMERNEKKKSIRDEILNR